jgi:hypothetical protein
MAVVPRTPAPTTWLLINTACMIVVVRAPAADDGSTVTAHNRPGADIQLVAWVVGFVTLY